MQTFRWQGLNAAGMSDSGTITAADQTAAMRKCQQQGIVAYALNPQYGLWERFKTFQFGDVSATPSDLADFYRAVADGMSTQQPLKQILNDAAATTKKRSNMGRALARMTDRIDHAKPSEVLRSETDVLGPEAAAVWEAAVNSPEPESVFNRLAEITQQNAEMRHRLKGTMSKPVLYLVVLSVVVAVLLTVLAPKMRDLYSGFDAELPFISRLVFGFGDFVGGNIVWLALGLVGAVAASKTALKHPATRLRASKAVQSIPVIGPITRSASSQRVCALLGVMLQANVPQEQALRIVSEAMPSAAAKHQVASTADALHNMPYDQKVEHYLSQNPLARSLHPMAYENNPSFRRLCETHELSLKPYPTAFSTGDVDERHELYQELAEIVWDPTRLGLIEVVTRPEQ